jgi:hypothetical protein
VGLFAVAAMLALWSFGGQDPWLVGLELALESQMTATML